MVARYDLYLSLAAMLVVYTSLVLNASDAADEYDLNVSYANGLSLPLLV